MDSGVSLLGFKFYLCLLPMKSWISNFIFLGFNILVHFANLSNACYAPDVLNVGETAMNRANPYLSELTHGGKWNKNNEICIQYFR